MIDPNTTIGEMLRLYPGGFKVLEDLTIVPVLTPEQLDAEIAGIVARDGDHIRAVIAAAEAERAADPVGYWAQALPLEEFQARRRRQIAETGRWLS